MKKHLLIIIVILMYCLSDNAENYKFKHLTSEQGLPYQQVEALMQDAKGNIWIGTRGGLSRYDGYSIKNYFHEDNDPNSLVHNFVNYIYLDKRKRLWICTQRGICRYRPTTDDFKSYRLPRGRVSSIAETSKGKIICGSEQLYIYDEKKDVFIPYPSFDHEYIISLAVDKKDNIFVATNYSIFYYNSSMTKITRLNSKYYADFITGVDGIIPMLFDSYGRLWIGRNGKGVMNMDLAHNISKIYEPKDISNGIVRVIKEDWLQNIWLGTEKGITIIKKNGDIEILRHRFQDTNCLSDNAIYNILCDRNHNIWIGSYFGGVDILLHNSKLFRSIEPGYNAHDIKGKAVRMIIETAPDKFWIATEDGGLNIYDANQGTINVFNKIPNLGTNIHSLYYNHKLSEIWIGTYRNGLYRYNLNTGRFKEYLFTNGLRSDAIFYFASQRNGRLWVATSHGLLYYDAEQDYFYPCGNSVLDSLFVYTLHVDKQDNVWVGTITQGLFRIDGNTRKITNWRKGDTTGLKDDYITCLYQDHYGRLWIGTNNNGLQYMDPKESRIMSVATTGPISQSTICSIIGDRNGGLWISSSLGLYEYVPAKHTFVRYTIDDGLPTNQFNFSSSLMSHNGTLLLGTVHGLVTFSPSSIHHKSGPFHVHLKNLIINNCIINASSPHSPLVRELDDTSEIILSYSQARSFSIEYGVIIPGDAGTIEYQIRLEGIDKEWRNVSSERKFVGNNLPVGTYYLYIRANNSNGNWNRCPVKSIKIIVEPPFYRSGWAYFFYLILASIFGYVVYSIFAARMRARNAIRLANIEKEKIEEIDRTKLNFFTAVSHELKTPLSLIIAPLKSISTLELSNKSKKYLETAIKNTQKMENLINELVTFNKVENANFPFYIQKGNPLEFIELLVLSFYDMALEKKIIICTNCENNGEEVWFSPSYIEHITNNLLSNALKFTQEGGRVIANVSITTIETAPYTYLKIEITDTGIGIENEELENIFERYYQTKRGYNVNNSGWGIGLALVKRLVEIHKGWINVESSVGNGSTFVVFVNVSDTAFDPKCKINEDKVIVPISQYKFSESLMNIDRTVMEFSAINNANHLSILIVDDNKDLLLFLSEYFSNKYNVYTAENGHDALEITHRENIQLVVSDVMMSPMDGFTLCLTLKQDMATSHIPVILLTAKTEQDDVVSGYKSGAEAYVSKPFDPQILELQIKNIIHLQKARQTEIVNAGNGEIDAISLSELDKSFLHKINDLVENNIDNSDFSVGDITKELAISRSLLHIKMRSLLNMSMGDYICKKRLDKACRLLHSGYNVSETAYQTGFSDPNYFSKTFKKHIGMSPTEYQKNI